MNPLASITAAQIALRTVLTHFMPAEQRRVLLGNLKGEEAQGIAEVVLRVTQQITSCPKTYETEAIESNDKIAYLHYFRGSVDAWIVERDIGDTPEGNGLGEQHQAFGRITLTGDPQDAEWGYISIAELIENKVELDLYWTPRNIYP